MKALATLLVLGLTGTCFASDPASPVRAIKTGSQSAARDLKAILRIVNAAPQPWILPPIPGIPVAQEPSLRQAVRNLAFEIEQRLPQKIVLGLFAPSVGVVDRKMNWFVDAAYERMMDNGGQGRGRPVPFQWFKSKLEFLSKERSAQDSE
jgi:hypothetical protein